MSVKLDVIPVLAELQQYGIRYETAGGDEVRIKCPFHKDGQEESPSCHVNTQKREFYCQTAGCNQRGDIITLLARVTKSTRAVVIAELTQRYELGEEKCVDPVTVERWHDAIWKADALRNELYARGITDAMIRRRRLGYDDNTQRITIPIPNASGAFVNVRKYLPGAPGKLKMRNASGFGNKPRWYPIDQLQYDVIMWCGGECKALLAADELNKFGIGAITVGSEKIAPATLLQDLKGKKVYVCMDVDDAGIKAAHKIATALRLYDVWCAVVHLPLDTDKYPKGDINDYVATERESLKPLIDAAVEYIPSYVDKLTVDTSPPEDFNLVEAIHADHSGKRMRLKGVVTAMETTPYLVPKDILIICDRGQDICALCPVAIKDRNEYTIPSESTAILEFVDASNDRQIEVVKSTIGIPRSCRICSFDKLSEYNVEDARIGPQLTIADRTGDRQPIPAICAGSGLTLNDAYNFIGKLVAHPKTQQATLLISEYVPSTDALGSYTVENAESLGIFWPEDWTTEAIETKLSAIYADLSYNATAVWGRRNLHLAIDLAYHSPLLINFDRQDEKGWIDLLVLGDSSTGKSQCLKGLAEHYRLGQIYDCSNSTPAGILGGMEKFGEKWMLTWGVIPRNDMRLVGLEEFHEAPEGTAAKIRDMRSRGIAQTVKIGGDRKTPARCRLIVNSNTASNCTMSSYSFGIEAILELMGTPQDVRRFDMAILTSNLDVPQSDFNKPGGGGEPVPATYTSELCQQLILWCWTRTREQVIFSQHATEAIFDEASRLCTTFSEVIPLVDRGSMRYKLARLSAALAGRLFSCSENYQNLLVHACHAEYIAKMLCETYSSPVFGYHTFSRAQELLETLLNPEQIREMVMLMPYPKDFCRSALAKEFMELQDLQDWCSYERNQGLSAISLLVRKHCLVRSHNYYRKTPPFIELLKQMENDDSIPENNSPKLEKF